ncbi:MAG: chromosomal replication initiator protein DnaA [Bacteroidota bacterium]|nr:chromosomal replication initiator protein DnaA [Bacteroidota bacterium]
MYRDHILTWNNILESLKRSLVFEEFKRWFVPIKPLKLEDYALTIEVPNQFVYERLEANYLELLKRCIRKELGDKGTLEYQFVMQEFKKPGVNKIKSYPASQDVDRPQESSSIEKNYNPFVIPGIRKTKVDPNLSAQYTFDNLVEGDCNRTARQAGLHIAKNPGHLFNPLVVYSESGLGKTHLAQAIGNGILQNHPDKNVLYLSSDKFVNQYINSVKNSATNEFLLYFQNLDAFIIDDIQFFAGKAGTQEIFFHLFNQLHQQGKQIILTSDCAPKEMKNIEDRLISRFKWGLVTDLHTPNFETRMAILMTKAEKFGISLSNKVMETICLKVKNNIRELEGILVRLVAESTINKRTIDIDLADELIQSISNQSNQGISLEDITSVVCDYLKLEKVQVLGKSRKSQIAQARQLSMFFSKKYIQQLTYQSIGDYFGGKDHTTVMHSCKVVQDQMDTDPGFKDKAEQLEKKLVKILKIK